MKHENVKIEKTNAARLLDRAKIAYELIPYRVDEEHLAALPENPISLKQAAALVQEKVPGSSASDVRLWEEGDDGRTRYEGDLLYGDIKYEFEIDPRTGRIFDWNADLRD